MAESFPYRTSLSVGKKKTKYHSLSVGKKKAKYQKSSDAVAAEDNQKELADLEIRTAEAEKNIKKLFKLADLEIKIGDLPASLSVGKNEANNKKSAVASKILAADPITLQELTDLEIKITEAEKNIEKLITIKFTDLGIKIAEAEKNTEERLIALGKSLKEQNSRGGLFGRFSRLQYPAYLSNTSPTRPLTSSNASKILADFEIKIAEAEKIIEKLSELSKSRNERNSRSNASLTRSQTFGMVTAFGFTGLLAGILVGLLPNKRR